MQLFVKKGISILVLLLVILIILAALGFAALRTLAPMGGKYTDNIQHAVSEIIGRPVRIGHLEFTVSGITPTARLNDLVIYNLDGSRPEMSFEEMDITLDMVSSAVKLDWIPSKVILRGSRMLIDRTLDGRLLVSGFEFNQGAANKEYNLDILNDLTFQLQDLDVYFNDAPLDLSYQLHTNQMDVYISKETLALNGVVTMPQEIDSEIELAIDIKGPVAEYRKWRGSFSASTNRLKLAGLPLELAGELPLSLDSGEARFVIWGDWVGETTLNAKVDLGLTNLNFEIESSDQSSARNLVVDSLQSKLDLSVDKGQWLINSDQLELVSDGEAWPATGYSVNFKLKDRKVSGLSANLDLVEVARTNALLAAILPQSHVLRAKISQHRPEGELSNLSLSYAGMAEDGLTDFNVSADFSDLQWQEYEKIPGIETIAGSFAFGRSGGEIDLQSNDMTFRSARLFEQTLQLNQLAAKLSWQTISNETVLTFSEVALENNDLSVSGNGSLTLSAENPPSIDLRLDSPGVNLSVAGKYLPLSLKPKVRGWISKGIIGGRADDASFSMQGPLSKAAFKNRELKLDGTVQTSGITVHYLNDYPDITDAGGLVTFKDYGLKVDLTAGQVSQSQITSGWVGIENYFAAIVKLDVHSDGTAAGGVEYLENSKLGSKMLPFLDSLEADGNVGLDLKIEVPLGTMKTSHARIVKGVIGLQDNRLALPSSNLEFLNTKGELSFDGGTFKASGIKSRFRGKPVQGAVVTKADREIHITVSGRMAVEELLPENKLFPAITSGNALWSGTVILPSRQDAANGVKQKLVLSSQLMGTELDLPDPVGKEADVVRRVRIETVLSGGSRVADIQYGDDLKAALELYDTGDTFRIQRAAITCGDQRPILPDRGYNLSGACGQVDLQSWIARVRELSDKKVAGEQAPMSVNASLDLLAFGGQSFRDVDLVMGNAEDYWNLNLNSESIAGDVQIPSDFGRESKLKATLDRLHLSAQEGAGGAGASPKVIPGLDVSIAEFVYNEKNLGAVNILSTREAPGMKIELLELKRDGITATIQGQWNEVGENSSVSQLEMDIKGKNFGALVSDLGVSKNMRDAEGELTADVSWQGAPYKIDFDTLSGVVNTTLREGSLADVEPGLARVFGLMNFDSLPKRLSLQFSDVAGSGFHFDKLAGRIGVEKGVATLDTVQIESDSANLGLAGSTDLVGKTYDLDLTVVPNVTSTVPLATTLIAGPQTGVLVYLLDKVSRGAGVDFNKSITQSYTIDGSWEAPEIEQSKKQQIDDEEDNLFEGD